MRKESDEQFGAWSNADMKWRGLLMRGEIEVIGLVVVGIAIGYAILAIHNAIYG